MIELVIESEGLTGKFLFFTFFSLLLSLEDFEEKKVQD